MCIIQFALCSDWADQQTRKKRKQKTPSEQREKYYQQMKRNMNFDSEPSEYLSAHGYIKAKTIDECVSMITRVSHEIHKLSMRKLDYYAMLGIELANLKVMYIENKCELCRGVEDDYEILDCKSCVSRKSKHAAEYMKKVKELIDRTSDYINFCIWIGRLYLKYYNFRHVTASIDFIKNKLTIRFLIARMAADSDFWKRQ